MQGRSAVGSTSTCAPLAIASVMSTSKPEIIVKSASAAPCTMIGLTAFNTRAAGITPRAYADFCRMESFKGGLRAGRSVTTALYDAGFGSPSRLYEKAPEQLGMTPGEYRRGGAGAGRGYGNGKQSRNGAAAAKR